MVHKFDYIWAHQILPKSLPRASNYAIISNVVFSSTGLVTWTTDIASTSQVQYGSNMYLGLMTDRDSTLVTNHSVQLPSLSPGTYYGKVQSFYLDSLSISDLYTFAISTPVATGSILMEDGTYILMEDGTKILVES